MRSNSRYRRNDSANRCAICEGRFGLVRHYCRRTALCSTRCVSRFRSRDENNRRWFLQLCTVQPQLRSE